MRFEIMALWLLTIVLSVYVGVFLQKEHEKEIVKIFKAVLGKKGISEIQLLQWDFINDGKLTIHKWKTHSNEKVVDVKFEFGEEEEL